jgi:hypothetical protein
MERNIPRFIAFSHVMRLLAPLAESPEEPVPCACQPQTITAATVMSGLFGSGPSTSAGAANNTQGDISHDIQVTSPPDDSISDICFSPQSDHLAVASWDKKVRIYEINSQGGSEGKALFEHEAPVLSVHWSKVCLSQNQSLYRVTSRLTSHFLNTGWHKSRRWRRRQSSPIT